MFLFEMLFLLLVIAGAILLVQGTRKVPVQYAKRIIGNKQYGGARQYIPLKVNAANVMPIIFAQAIMFIPISIVGFSRHRRTVWFRSCIYGQYRILVQLRICCTDYLVYIFLYSYHDQSDSDVDD